MNSNLVLRSQSGHQFDALASIDSVLKVFNDVVRRTSTGGDLVSTLARASVAELEDRINACEDYLMDGCDIAVSDAVLLAVEGLRFSHAQLRAIAVVADPEVADWARDGAQLVSAELLHPEGIWVRV